MLIWQQHKNMVNALNSSHILNEEHYYPESVDSFYVPYVPLALATS